MDNQDATTSLLINELESPQIDTRLSAITTISKHHSQNTLCTQSLISALSSESVTEVKAAICIALGETKTNQSKVVQVLCHALNDDAPLVREHAISALHNFVDAASPAIANLIYCLKDSSVHVRANAAWLLGKLNNPASIITESLCDCLNDSEALVRWRSARALKQLNAISIRIVLSLENALLDPNYLVACAAKEAFISIQDRNVCQLPTSLVA